MGWFIWGMRDFYLLPKGLEVRADLLPCIPQCVCREDCGVELVRCDVAGHVVDGFAVGAGLFCDHADFFLFCDADLLKSDGKSDLQAEVLNLFKFFLGCALQYELNQRAEGDAVSVGNAVTAQGGQTVVERVRRGKTAVVGADAGKINVRLDDRVQRGRYQFVLAGILAAEPYSFSVL